MKEELKKELEEISPFLIEMKEKPEGRTVPNHFFNNMQLDIMNKVKAEQQQIPAKKSWFSVLKYRIESFPKPQLALGLVGVLVFVVGGFLFFSKNINTLQSDNCNDLTCISEEETVAYINENINDFDEKMFLEVAHEQDENTTQTTTKNETNKSLQSDNTTLDELVDEMLKNGELNEEEL